MLIHWLLNILIASSLLMLILWCWQLKSKDASLVDAAWAFSIGLAIIYIVIINNNYSLRHLLIAFFGLLWAFRLSFHLSCRIFRSNKEDTRYQTMRAAMGNYAPLGFFVFFQIQALFVVIFSTPIVIALLTPGRQISVSDGIGFVIFAIAIIGESLADKQLNEFKQNNRVKSITCQSGLWNYSRHPNYFFEWLHWFAYPLFSLDSQYFWLTCFMPFVMLFFLLKLTGINHVEREAIKKKPDYKNYIKTTSCFIPWFKKK